MNTKSIQLGLKAVFNEFKKRDTDIMIGVGVAGLLCGTFEAVKATPKAIQLINEKKEKENKDELNAVETIQTTWKCYVPTMFISAVSIGCIIFSTIKNNKKHAALAMAYSVANNAFIEYQDKVKESIGGKKEQKIRDEIAKEQLEKNPVEKFVVEETGYGDLLCWNGWAGGYFKSSPEAIGRALNEANDMMLNCDYISLNDFYDFLNIRGDTQQGNLLGWNRSDGLIELVTTYEKASNGNPCLVFTFRTPPDYYYNVVNKSRKNHTL